MKLSQYIAAYCVVVTSAINAASLPGPNALDILEAHSGGLPRSDILAPDNALEKRKGGGGKGGGGGGGGGKTGGGGGGGRTAATSNVGGATRSGSGPPRSYGGGGYYGGGAAVPYQAGKRSTGGVLPGAALGVGAAALIFPGIWLWSVYPYGLRPYTFYNHTANRTRENEKRQEATGMNETLPVTCLCQDFAVCGCDSNDNAQYLNDLVGNGSYAALNKTVVTVGDVSGTRTLLLNGTLPNGTTASGGTDDAASGLTTPFSGYLIIGGLFFYAVALL
ncbi:hypothetical protein EJ04DRAFT_510994 [Polyplosphaeria fusca]|uniref:DUF7732 domain-containing protein n=1 Tax=Polyplosphaeria fusca TaxID=682080 RepID=A0A9P4R0R6_9PLEO|nr:hypothetical protein EJ04DRAFT_510994 [Polyplosphaeria fusca]